MEPEKSRHFLSHLDQCERCRDLAAGLAAEGRLIRHWLQEVDLQPQTEAASMSSVARGSLIRLGTAVLVPATVVQIAIDWLAGFNVPPVLGWLDPLSLPGKLNISANAIPYVLEEGEFILNTMIRNASSAVLAILLLTALRRCLRVPAWSRVLPVALLLVAFVHPGQALDVRGDSASVIVASGETIDDSVIFLGESITINGTVTGDLIAVGSKVTIRGSVQGSVFSCAQRVEVAGRVGGNLFGFAQSVTVGDGGEVAGNGLVGAQDVLIAGAVLRDLTVGANSLEIDGALGRNLLFGGSVLTVLAPARIDGSLKAHLGNKDNFRIDPGASIMGATTLEVPEPEPSRFATTGFYVKGLIRLAAAMVAGLVLFWLFPPARQVRLGDGRALLAAGALGFVAAVATPVVAVIAGITLIGLPVALASLAAWLVGLYLGKIVVARYTGQLMLASFSIKAASTLGQLVVGLAAVIIATSLPYVGGLVNILLTLLGFGALLATAYKSWRGRLAFESQVA